LTAVDSQLPEILVWLQSAGLLREAPEGDSIARLASLPLTALLTRLCDAGLLVGGLSVSSDLEPEALFGSLAQAMGAPVSRLKLNDVRKGAVPELWVDEERWKVPSLRTLIAHFNEKAGPKRCVVLGEWEEMLQLWALAQSPLRQLLRRPDFQPENLGELRR
jgi:hypothetical protein